MVDATFVRKIPATIPLRQAGFITRATALVMDIVLVTAGSIIFAALVSLILNFFGISSTGFTSGDTIRNLFVTIQLAIIGLAGLAVLLFVPGYFVLFWVLIGAISIIFLVLAWPLLTGKVFSSPSLSVPRTSRLKAPISARADECAYPLGSWEREKPGP